MAIDLLTIAVLGLLGLAIGFVGGLLGLVLGITDMKLGPDGYVYLLALGDGGNDCIPRRVECVEYDSSAVIGSIYKLKVSTQKNDR